MKTRRLILLNSPILALFVAGAVTASAEKTFPKVLIIGDSISLGYTPYVKQLLNGKAEVVHHRGNAGPTMRGIDEIDNWLGDTRWDVIHFNWGLWDMYGWQYEKQDRSPEAYEKRLNTLVLRLKKTGAKLIWATTTPTCPEAEKKCLVKVDAASEREYLAAARRVMKKHHIQINDLHGCMAPKRAKFSIAVNDVHYTKEGYKKLAEQVAKQINLALPPEVTTVPPTIRNNKGRPPSPRDTVAPSFQCGEKECREIRAL